MQSVQVHILIHITCPTPRLHLTPIVTASVVTPQHGLGVYYQTHRLY